MIIYLNGDYVTEDEAKVSVFDHGFLYGDGVFEGIRAYSGRVFALDDHVERLYESARSIQLQVPLSQQEMKEVILETIRRNGLRDAYIRPVVSRGRGALGLDPTSCKRATVVVIVDGETMHPEDSPGNQLSQTGIKVITSTFRRNGPDVLSPRVKSTNYLNNILAKLQANAFGCKDAVFLNADGFVCELTGDNLFIVKNSRLVTPPLWHGVLDGVTRRVVLRIAAELGLHAAEEPLTLHDLYTCDECFCTATRVEIVPIVSVDGREIGDFGPGPITNRILSSFLEHANSEGTAIYH